ncbi:hypothetical protein [Geomonas oryzae]|uniref:hypothetical protein n=1 Tax=Geomonas oryzae TaxID=2364273 RepID=UPI00100B3FAF
MTALPYRGTHHYEIIESGKTDGGLRPGQEVKTATWDGAISNVDGGSIIKAAGSCHFALQTKTMLVMHIPNYHRA